MVSKDYDSDDFDEEKALTRAEERLVVKPNNNRNKRQNWHNKGNGPKNPLDDKDEIEAGEEHKTYGNSYGRKG